jgi:hypothetical protein
MLYNDKCIVKEFVNCLWALQIRAPYVSRHRVPPDWAYANEVSAGFARGDMLCHC